MPVINFTLQFYLSGSCHFPVFQNPSSLSVNYWLGILLLEVFLNEDADTCIGWGKEGSLAVYALVLGVRKAI